MPNETARPTSATANSARDLSDGVIVVLSGGAFDGMNPPEVRAKMDEYVSDVNADPYVQANSAGQGLRFMLLPAQTHPHLHQTRWREICDALSSVAASPVILVGHSNGGAAAVDLARCLKHQGKQVDLLFSADSVLTLDDNGDVNEIPSNVTLNFNPYVIPTPAWLLAPFPIGKKNHRESGMPLDGIVNIGLVYNLPGALAHRNAFYELAGGDKSTAGEYQRPHFLLQVTLAVLRGEGAADIIQGAEAPLQQLATKSRLEIELETSALQKTLHP